MAKETKINVYNSILVDGSDGIKRYLPIATIKHIIDYNKELIEFKYTKEWLEHKDSYPITPLLPLSTKKYIEDAYHENFSIFRDYDEDSWVEYLLMAKKGISIKRAININYLLSIDDYLGIGDLRFRKYRSSDDVNYASYSPLSFQDPEDFVNKVVYASKEILFNDTLLTEKEKKGFLSELISCTCNLGGTSAKDYTIDPNNELWIKKFSYFTTEGENVALQLAKSTGLNVPSFCMYRYKNDYFLNTNCLRFELLALKYVCILYTKRFDRDGEKKIPFATANSLLGNEYKVASRPKHSYLELAQFITKYGDISDLEELWKRMVFNICIGNRDDSLYKHGFLYKDGKWRLSPLYGVKFSTDCISKNKGLGLNIDDTHSELDLDLDVGLALELALKVIKHFRVPEAKAKFYIKRLLYAICYYEPKLIGVSVIEKDKIVKYAQYANKIKITNSDVKVIKGEIPANNLSAKGNPNRSSNGRFKKKD